MRAYKKKRSAVRHFVLLSGIILALIIFVASSSALTTMVSEIVSISSTHDSRFPAVAVGDDKIIHVVWEDDTELNETGFGSLIQNGPDKDIFYISKNLTEWSSKRLEGSKIVGGTQVLSNDSITSSMNPAIAVGLNNITYVVWQGIVKPDELSADSNTTFLAHFDMLDFSADYAAGQATPILTSNILSSPNSLYNGSVNVDQSDKLAFNATNNINLSKGTIEFWYNPQHLQRSNDNYALFSALNSSGTRFDITYYELGGSNVLKAEMIYNSSYTFELRYHPVFEIKKNEWKHIAFTYDFGTGNCRLYYEGYLADANDSCKGTSFNPENFTVGYDQTLTSVSYPFRADGMIDELRISNNVRSADEIRKDAGQRDLFLISLNSTWSNMSVITSDDDNNSYFPRIGIDKNNTLRMVWNSYHNATFSTIKYRHKGTGAWSSAEVVSSNASSNALSYFPDIAVDANNNSNVVWQDVDASAGNFSGFSIVDYRQRNQTNWAGIQNVSNRTYEVFGVNASRISSVFLFETPRIAAGTQNTTHIVWATQSPFPDKDLLFYLSFDSMDANVTFANGSTLSNNNASYLFYPGKTDLPNPNDIDDIINTGHAAYVNGSAAFLNYSAANNLNPNFGTIMLWIKPNWEPGSVEPGRINSIFTYYSSNATQSDINEYLSLYIQQCLAGSSFCSDETSSLLYFRIFENTSTAPLAAFNTTDWLINEWHHVAVTWNLTGGPAATKMYIDGSQISATIFPNVADKMYFNDTPTEIIMGNIFNESTGNYPYAFNGSIDEVMVFGRILEESEINAAWQRDIDIVYRKKNDSGWQNYEFLSFGSNKISVLPSIAAKDSNVYAAWPGSVSDYQYKSATYVYGALYKIVLNRRNSTSWQDLEILNNESSQEAYSPDIKAVRPGKIETVWEDNSGINGNDIDILYREMTNSTPSSVMMTYPTGGEILNANFNVNASASDPDSAISNISFYYMTEDGISGSLICTATSSPYSCSWIIGATAEDIYKVKAIATSDDGGRNFGISDFIYLDSSSSIKIYNFNSTGNDLGNHAIYQKGYTNATASRPDPANSSSLGEEITGNDTVRANVSSPDNQRITTSINLGCGTYNFTNAAVFKFYIDDTPSNISNIRIQWQGYGYYKKSGYLTNLSIWNFDTSSWETLAYKEFGEAVDDDLSATITSNFSSYLDSVNNTMYLLAETDDYANSGCGYGFVCPLYLSWNGTDYNFETEGILGIFDSRVEMPTYDRMYNIKPANDAIKVAIAEVMDETTYMDAAKLIVVDHDSDDLMIDMDGNPHTIKDKRSVGCIDRLGNDCTKLVEAEDEKPASPTSSLDRGLTGSRSLFDPILENGPEGNYWVSNLSSIDLEKTNERRDYIEITLPEDKSASGNDADNGINENDKGIDDNAMIKLIVSGSDTGFLGESEGNLFTLAGDSVPYLYNLLDNTILGKLGAEGIFRTAPIRIQVLDDEGSWVDYPERFDNAMLGSYRTLLFPLKKSLIRGNKLRINTLLYAYAIDYIAVDYSDDEEVSVTIEKPNDPVLAESDDVRKKLRTGDFLELSFREPEKDSSRLKRSYFLMTEGYYHPNEIKDRASYEIEEIKNPADIISSLGKLKNGMTYARMIYDPSYAERYMLDYYLKTHEDGGKITYDLHNQKVHRVQSPQRHNSLLTDFVRVTVGTCTVPVDDLEIFTNTTFCAGDFSVPDSDGDGAVIKISGDNITLDCGASTLDSGGNSNPSQNEGAGVAIGLNHTQNVIVRNCQVSRYGIGLGMNYSTGAQFINNTVSLSYIGIGGDHSNSSVIKGNLVKNSFYAAYGFVGKSMHNNLTNNSAINTTLLGFALDDSDNNTMEFNTINGSASLGFLHLGGIGLTRGADHNTIRNNTISNLYLGIGMADVGTFLNVGAYGDSGMFNNFTSNLMYNMLINGIGLLYPHDNDYYNYFDQNNIVEGERTYYYFNLNGNETNYQQITGMNLTGANTSMFTGKLTIVNSSYINITNSNFTNNFYGLLIFDSHHILVSNNRALNNGDAPLLNLFNTNIVVGGGIVIINSRSVNVTDNNATGNFYGYYTKNSANLTFINNTAKSNSWVGFLINTTNISIFANNTASLNDVASYAFMYSWLNSVVNNTARDAMEIGPSDGKEIRGRGFYFLNTFNNTIKNNIAYNNTYGLFMSAFNDTYTNNTLINNSVSGMLFENCINGTVINESGNIVTNNTGNAYSFFACNSTLVINLNATLNGRAGFEIYHTSLLTLSNIRSKNNYYGIIFNQSQNNTVSDSYSINSTSHEVVFSSSTGNNIVNSFIINNVSGNDVYSEVSSWNNLLNATFNQSNFGDDGTSNASVQWYLDLYIMDNESIPVSGASITLNDTFGNNYSGITDTNARARFNLTEYTIKGGSKTYFSNYTWNITKAGYMSNVSMVNMSQNREINVTINLLGGIPDISPPTTPFVYDGYDYVDFDWTNNASTLFASWSNSTDRHLIFYGYRILENGTCLAGKCAPTEAGQSTQIMINGLTLLEGYNYSIGVRARDTNYYYTSFVYSDGIILDVTPPTATINSTSHPNSSQFYSNPNVTFMFYGNDTLSGIAGFSFVLDENSGTGPDLIEESRANTLLQPIKNTGGSRTLRANNTGTSFAVFSQVRGNITAGDNVTVTVALSEDVSDTINEMSINAYLLTRDAVITSYDMENQKISGMQTLAFDISHRNLVDADTYTLSLMAASNSSDSFYVVIASNIHDDNNTHNISIAGTTTSIDNTTQSFICEEGGSCTNTTLTFDYAIKVEKKESGTVWYKTYSMLTNGEHWFHVRAKDIAGNWGNPSHFKVMIDAVNGTPLYTLVKPVGYIATTEPLLVANTNEYTACLYNTTNTTYAAMTSYDGIHHEFQLSGLAEQTYTYSFNCTDAAGNSGYNDTTFIVNMNATPDTVSIYSMGNYTVGKSIAVNVNATKVFNGISYGIGELAPYFSANLTNSTTTYKISINVVDLGNGIYSVSFDAPLKTGDYTLTVSVRGVTDTQTFSTKSFSLTLKYSSSEMSFIKATTRMAYGAAGNSYMVGLAGDASGATTSGSASPTIQIAGPAVNDNLFIFITRSNAEPGKMVKYIDGASLLDQQNPSFGYSEVDEEHVLSAMLEYGDISITGTDEVESGRYTLLIKNEGINQTTGKTKVSISII